MTGILLISAHILVPPRMSRSFKKWANWIDMNPEDKTSSSTQYQEALLMYLENEYCANHQCLPVMKPESLLSNHLFCSAISSISGQSSNDPYDLSSNDGDCLMHRNVARTTPGQNNCALWVLKASQINSDWPPEFPQGWGQINPNHNNYHSDLREFSSTSWIPDITHWWCQQVETLPKYANLCNVARDNLFIILKFLSFVLWVLII